MKKEIIYTGNNKENRIEFFNDSKGRLQGEHTCYNNMTNAVVWRQYWKDNQFHGMSYCAGKSEKIVSRESWKDGIRFGQQNPNNNAKKFIFLENGNRTKEI